MKFRNQNPIEYQIICLFYENKTAKRSGVHLMNHINEGLEILESIEASQIAMRAYCLHPIFQCDEDLLSTLKSQKFYAYSIDPESIITAMEYRAVANAYLSQHYKGPDDVIKLSPLKAVNDMLIADKIQNRKDFELYHLGKHERSDILDAYFKNWLRALGVSEEKYKELSSAL